MDTRTKIVTPAVVAGPELPRPLLLVTGYFDILQVDSVRELADARQRHGAQTVAALVLPFAGEHLPLDGRREMAAALRVIDYVLIAKTEDLDSLVALLQPIEIIRLENAEMHRIQQLTEHVRSR